MTYPPSDPRDFPDPFVVVADGGYLALATNARGSNVQVMASTDLVGWAPRPDALPRLPAWGASGFTWAPSVLERPGGYVLYYTVREPRAGLQAISCGASADPGGPFADTSSGPLVYQQHLGGSIDPSPFVDTDGTAYLLWKADANAVRQRASLWIQALTDDGLALAGQAVRLLDCDARWERPLVEAPCLVHDAGTYYLFYSANWWNTDRYAVGYATATAVLGPYTKATRRRPWFGSDRSVSGPGGQECFVDLSGQLRMAFHGWMPRRVGYPLGARSLRLATLSFSQGAPVLS
ncbi:MAG: glycoside hydrolase family 43 protein [Acidimicrobiales bacterium]